MGCGPDDGRFLNEKGRSRQPDESITGRKGGLNVNGVSGGLAFPGHAVYGKTLLPRLEGTRVGDDFVSKRR